MFHLPSRLVARTRRLSRRSTFAQWSRSGVNKLQHHLCSRLTYDNDFISLLPVGTAGDVRSCASMLILTWPTEPGEANQSCWRTSCQSRPRRPRPERTTPRSRSSEDGRRRSGAAGAPAGARTAGRGLQQPGRRARETAEVVAARHGAAVERMPTRSTRSISARWAGRPFAALAGDPRWQALERDARHRNHAGRRRHGGAATGARRAPHRGGEPASDRCRASAIATSSAGWSRTISGLTLDRLLALRRRSRLARPRWCCTAAAAASSL